MTVASPPRPPQTDPEALIEEARRRARRRRFIYAAGMCVVVLGATAAYLEINQNGAGQRGRSGGRAQAGGTDDRLTIRHAVYRDKSFAPQRPGSVRFDLATGRATPVEETNEIWLDTRSGLYRLQMRLGSWVVFDGVGTTCLQGLSKRECLAYPRISPFSEAERYTSAFGRGKTRTVGTGAVDGHRVIWVANVYRGKTNIRERAALDVKTHKLRAVRQLFRGRPEFQQDVPLLDSVPTGSIHFPVPKGGPPWSSVPPLLPVEPNLGTTRLSAARKALNPPAFWLGRRFAPLPLVTVESGAEDVKGVHGSTVGVEPGATLASVPYVRLTYGQNPRRTVVLEEFNPQPSRLLRGQGFIAPPPGILVLQEGQSYGVLRHDGVIVRITAPGRKAVIAAARGLRRIPRSG